MKSPSVAAIAAALSFATPAAACPEFESAPNYGSVELSAGFLPDPYRRSLTAGGTTDLAGCFRDLNGYVTVRPDFDLYWSGTSSRLKISVISDVDAVLLVNAPNGQFHYNDDYRDHNPAMVFENPQEGLYDIWIGTFDGSSLNPAQLVITERPD